MKRKTTKEILAESFRELAETRKVDKITIQAIQFLKTTLEDWKMLTLVTPLDKKQNVKFYTEKCGYTGIPICLVATFAAVQEGHFIRTGKEN